MKIRSIVILAGLLLSFNTLLAQELRCSISLNTSKIQGTNKSVFTTLQTALYEFVNNTSWTQNVFDMNERIECSMLLTITEQFSASEFAGALQIQASRPVYGSSYQTVTFNYLDNDIRFSYVEFDKLEFNESTYTSSLTSLIAYYVYVILGIDYDTYSPKGGNDYFKIAQRIVMNAQDAPESGWKPYETSRRNRYWLVDNILDTKYSLMRNAYYKYYRLGLDKMSDKVDEGRENILDAMLDIQKVYRDKPDPYLFYFRVFFDAHSEEIVNIFSEASPPEKSRVYQILTEVDNVNENRYAKIKESASIF